MPTLNGQRRRTPCVGICSTTFGDLVCRGCKRFAHEIVGWNGYSAIQRQQIEERLRALRCGAIEALIRVRPGASVPAEPEALLAALTVPLDGLEDGSLWRSHWERQGVSLPAFVDSALSLQQAVEQEWLIRSRGVYERSFRVAAD